MKKSLQVFVLVLVIAGWAFLIYHTYRSARVHWQQQVDFDKKCSTLNGDFMTYHEDSWVCVKIIDKEKDK